MTVERGYITTARDWFEWITGAWPEVATSPAVTFEHPGVPISKGRPRTGKGQTFTPKRTRDAESSLAWSWKIALRGRKLAGNLGIVCIFYRPDRRVVDGDNLLKLVCDAGNLAGAWADDCQITTKLVRVELDAKRPRTEIAVGHMPSSLAR